jgi:alpha-2-macroglobulin
LYIDEKPVFFSQAEQLDRYSFRVKPGRHALRIRTHNRMIKLDSILVQQGVKNFICIEADSANNRIKMERLPDTLTNYEKELWTKYMIVVQNMYGEDFATIEQGDNLYLLPQNNGHYAPNAYRYNSPFDILVGPLPTNYAALNVKTQFMQSFITEPGYSFTIEKGLIKQKSLPYKYPFRSYLSSAKPQYNFNDFVLTEEGVDSLWQNYLDNRARNEQLYSNKPDYNGASLTIKVDTLANGKQPFVKTIFLFRYDDPDYVRIYRGAERSLGVVKKGKYKLMLLFKAGEYALYDSVEVKERGYNYFATGMVQPKPTDSIGTRMNASLDEWKKTPAYYGGSFYNDGSRIKEIFNDRYFNQSMLASQVSGRITTKTGQPIMYVSVKVKGLSTGVATDAEGYFTINTPQRCTLEFSTVGFEYQQRDIEGSQQLNITMYESTSALNEVVVVGYGATRKKDLTGSVVSVKADNLLLGKLAGVQIVGTGSRPGSGVTVKLRGVNSITDVKSPLYILDGEVFDGDVSSISIDNLQSIDVLKDAAAVAVYGAAAVNGVIVMTTKKGKTMLLDSVVAENAKDLPNTLRRNFKDDGFWQPRLRTNDKGKAAFTVTFPDDITRWRTFYLAMTDKKQTGMTELSIRSFKPLSASLALPQFLVQGDSINLIGKVLNYNSDTATGSRKFFVNSSLLQQQNISVANARIDTFGLRVQTADSVKLKYTIEQNGGYFDGEERSIPVFVQGTRETDGMFAVLDKDTSFTIQPFNKNAAITLYAEASVLPVLLDEIDKVKRYEYLCNEQLASKLKALLLEKKIRKQLNQPFKEEKNIETIIAKLTQNRGRNFMWGWWANNDPSLWITLHVTEALLQAEAMGYTINLAKQPVIDYIVYNQESFYREDKVRALLLLKRLGAKADFKKYADSIDAHIKLLTMYQRLQWMDTKLQLGLPANTDSVLQWASRTMFGNLYWGEEGYRFFDNAVHNTLLAYSILRRQGGNEEMLKKIRYYFLEKTKSGQWRNTYESALILETILPDLLAEAGTATPPSFTISGTKNITVTNFPFTMQATAADTVTIAKKAGLPVYFTAYQQYHNAAPQKVSNDFEVTTVFENNGRTISQLKAGEAVVFKTTVNVKADADYVMVEVPIPAGCSYKSKEQGYAYNEVHREHFKNKVSIFCTALKKGSYTFTVELLPRYNGLYNLNPAKAEMMYFPVFYGREGMKVVEIR